MKRGIHSLALFSSALALLVACGGSDVSDESAESMMEAETVGAHAGGAGAAATDAEPSSSAAATVSGPITSDTGSAFSPSSAFVDLDSEAYTEKEFFFEGDATGYALEGEMTMDGKWLLTETTTAPFKTRMLVRRPVDASEFNGTVVIEWLNVSGGFDADPGFMYNYEEVLREGYVWIAVSAQAQGVQGGGFSFQLLQPDATPPLTQFNPERYGSLSHPGDDYSFDIFTRAAQIVRGAGDVDVLEGLEPERLIGYGESQSAGRLVSYVNGVHPLVEVYDGFFIHSRGGGGVAFSTDAAALPSFGMGGMPALIRDDLEEPVFQFQTETDVLGMLGFVAARQPDTDRLRTWEVAGTAHVDQHLLGIEQQQAEAAGIASPVQCEGANDGPQHFVIKAALHALNRWLADGTAPAMGEPLRSDANGAPATDEHGNALGGVRTPHVDVPIATHSGNAAPGSADFLCFLFGSTTPFPPEKLMEMYTTHDDYVAQVRDSAAEIREAGFLLEPEEQTIVAEAEAAMVPP